MTAALVAGVIACWGAALVVVVMMLHRAHSALAPTPRPPTPLPARRWHAHALTRHGEVCLEDHCPYPTRWDVPTDLRVTT